MCLVKDKLVIKVYKAKKKLDVAHWLRDQQG